MIYSPLQWLTFFYFYSFLGWIWESSYVSARKKRFVNRGFLHLPLLPLYGSGAVLVLFITLPVRDNPALVYLTGAVSATVLEYVTGVAMEALYKVKYWDYSSKKYNIQGIICLESTLFWGVLTVVLVYAAHKPVEKLIFSIDFVVLTVMDSGVSVIFLCDFIISNREALRLAHVLAAIEKAKLECQDELHELELQLAEQRNLMEGRIEFARERAEARMDEMKERADARMDEMKERADVRMSEMKERADARMGEMKERADARMDEMKERADVRMNEIRGQAEAHLDEWKEQSDARLTAIRSRTENHLEELKERADTHMTEIRSQTEAHLDEWKERVEARRGETHGRTEPHMDEARKQAAENSELLQKKIAEKRHAYDQKREALLARAETLSAGILRRNPTAASRRYGETIRELHSRIRNLRRK